MTQEPSYVEIEVHLEEFKALRAEIIDKLRFRWQLAVLLISIGAGGIGTILALPSELQAKAFLVIPPAFCVFAFWHTLLWTQVMNMGIYIDQVIRPKIETILSLHEGERKGLQLEVLAWEHYTNLIERNPKAIILTISKRVSEYVLFLLVAVGSLAIFFATQPELETSPWLSAIAITEAILIGMAFVGLLVMVILTEKYWLEKGKLLQAARKHSKQS